MLGAAPKVEPVNSVVRAECIRTAVQARGAPWEQHGQLQRDVRDLRTRHRWPQTRSGKIC